MRVMKNTDNKGVCRNYKYKKQKLKPVDHKQNFQQNAGKLV